MAMEAHRLIALSLRKIAASRGQRGGVNLHKNLLVASVLFKARYAFLAENSINAQTEDEQQVPTASVVDDHEDDDDVEDCHNQELVEEDNMDNTEADGVPHITSSKSKQDNTDSESCQVEPMDVTMADDDVGIDSEGDSDCDKENSPPTQTDLTVTVVTEKAVVVPGSEQSPCAKCTTKRRLTEDGDSQSSLPSPESPAPSPCKRARTCHTNDLVTQQTTASHVSCKETSPHVGGNGNDSTSKMDQNRCAVQMNSLVHRFNTGLTGILSSVRSNQNDKEVNGQCNSAMEKDSPGLCSNSVSSCSTQIKEAFETLSRPVLALAV